MPKIILSNYGTQWVGKELYPGESPYYTSDTGFDWYLDTEVTRACTHKRLRLPPIQAVAFIIAKDNVPYERVLVDIDTNEPLYSTTILEDMYVHIDMLRLANSK